METLHTSLSGLIKEQAAAEHLGLSVRTLQAYRVQGGGPPFYKIGRAVRYRLGDLDKFIEARLRFNTSYALS